MPRLTPERWRQVAPILDAALDLPREARASFVARACAGRTELRVEVERMLGGCENAEGAPDFLREPAAARAAPLLSELARVTPQGEADAAPEAFVSALAERYTVLYPVGSGGMATVYLADDLRYHRRVALKVLRPAVTDDAGARFVREIEIVAPLRHPHIVPLYHSGEAAGLLYYVMPFVEGESLRARLRRECRLPADDALRIATEVADALDYAHQHGVVHRDIKPENILLEGRHAVVADFGVARAIEAASSERLTSPGMAVGTLAYMSPEQIDGAARVDGRSDIYSLASVVYEMLAGTRLMAGGLPLADTPTPTSSPEAGKAAPSRPRVVRRAIRTEVRRVLATALAEAPEERFASAGEFVQALQAAIVASKRRRRRLVAAAGIMAAVIPAIAVLVGAIPGLPPAPTGGPRAGPAVDPRRIAVVYFDDLTPERSLGHVASGLTEDLIDELSSVSALHVISPNGVRPYRATATPVDSIARALGVGTIVAGSVARSGPVLRVTTRLIDAQGGRQLQSRTLEEPWQELFTLQDKLALEVTSFLRQRLGREVRLREQRAGTKSVRAWELVQQADELADEGAARVRAGDQVAAVGLLWRADSSFARAEQLDPSWIVPTVGRGWLAQSLAFVSPGPTGDPGAVGPAGVSGAWIRRGIDHADAALRREPASPEARALRGHLRHRLVAFGLAVGADSLRALIEADLRAAVEARPDLARAWFSLAELYFRAARFADAARAARQAFDADAFLAETRSVVHLLFFASLYAERLDEARAWCRMGVERYPDDPRFASCDITLLGWSAREPTQAAAAWRRIADVERRDSLGALAATWADRRTMVAAVLARAGMPDSARAVLDRIRAELPAHPGSSDVRLAEAYVRLLLGERQSALSLLAAYLESAPDARDHVARSPWYRALHADPGFRAMVKPVD